MGNKETVDHWKAGEISISGGKLSLCGAMLGSSQRDFFMWKTLSTRVGQLGSAFRLSVL